MLLPGHPPSSFCAHTSPHLATPPRHPPQEAFISTSVFLEQNQDPMINAPNLDAGAVNPRGYWCGGVSGVPRHWLRAHPSACVGVCMGLHARHTPGHSPFHPHYLCSPHSSPHPQAAFTNGRIYIADRTDIVDPPLPPGSGNPYVQNPRPGIYWAWVQPTFAAYGPCGSYWNFNWGYGGWRHAGSGGWGGVMPYCVVAAWARG